MVFKVKIIIIISTILFTYLYYTKPKTLVVNESGRVEGLANKARALIQKKRFWDYQLLLANKEFESRLNDSSPSDILKILDKIPQKTKSEANDFLESNYFIEQKRIKALREEADRLERMQEWRYLDEIYEESRQERISKLIIIIPIIKVKSSTISDSGISGLILTLGLMFSLGIIVSSIFYSGKSGEPSSL